MEHLKVGPGIDALKLHHSINTSTFAQGCVPAGHFSGEDRGVFPRFLCAEHDRQPGGASPLSSLMGRRISEAQGQGREAMSERSVEQNRDSMDKNRITRPTRGDERANDREVHSPSSLGVVNPARARGRRWVLPREICVASWNQD